MVPELWARSRRVTDVLVNLGGVATIGLVVWWFWLAGARRGAVGEVGEPPEIIVEDGVYTPARVEVALGQPVILRFLRKDPSPCAEKVIFSDLNVSSDLAVGKVQEVKLRPSERGEFEFTCQMGMYRGLLIVR